MKQLLILMFISLFLTTCSQVRPVDYKKLLVDYISVMPPWDSEETMTGYDSSVTDNIRQLVEKGADPNARDSLGRPLVLIAAQRENDRALIALLDQGADPDAVDSLNESALYFCCLYAQVMGTKALIAHNANLNIKSKRSGYTPLMICVSYGREKIQSWSEEICEMLLNAGAEPNHRDSLGRSALTLALLNYPTDIYSLPRFSFKMVKALVDHGSELDVPDAYGDTPLGLAIPKDDPKFAGYLIMHGATIATHRCYGTIYWQEAFGKTGLTLSYSKFHSDSLTCDGNNHKPSYNCKPIASEKKYDKYYGLGGF